MRKTQFSEETMVAIRREADKAPVAEVARRHKVSEPGPAKRCSRTQGAQQT